MIFLNTFMMQQLEAYVGSVDPLLDDKENLWMQVLKNFFNSTLMHS